MSREAISSVAFIAKPPTDRSDLNRILDLAGRLLEQVRQDDEHDSDSFPDNVIPFPGC
jgi:hypothetical protein